MEHLEEQTREKEQELKEAKAQLDKLNALIGADNLMADGINAFGEEKEK